MRMMIGDVIEHYEPAREHVVLHDCLRCKMMNVGNERRTDGVDRQREWV